MLLPAAARNWASSSCQIMNNLLCWVSTFVNLTLLESVPHQPWTSLHATARVRFSTLRLLTCITRKGRTSEGGIFTSPFSYSLVFQTLTSPWLFLHRGLGRPRTLGQHMQCNVKQEAFITVGWSVLQPGRGVSSWGPSHLWSLSSL